MRVERARSFGAVWLGWMLWRSLGLDRLCKGLLGFYRRCTDGFGALLRGGRTVGYYRTGGASYGFQAGVKKFGYALFFMTRAALNYLDTSGGWAIGTGPSLVVVDQGVARSLTTTNLRADVYAFVFDQRGLMGGIGIEGRSSGPTPRSLSDCIGTSTPMGTPGGSARTNSRKGNSPWPGSIRSLSAS